MDKMNYAPLAGKFRPLNFSIEVMFDAVDKYGGISEVFDILGKENRESGECIEWLLQHMANDAELARRKEGYDPEPFLTEEDVKIKNPTYYQIFKAAVIAALDLGYSREVEDPKGEVDLGLQELNAKKEKAGD